MKEENNDEFQSLRKILVERLENTWKDLDEDVLEIIDEILHQHGKKKYLSIAQRESLRNALFYRCGVWMFWKNCWRMIMLQKL